MTQHVGTQPEDSKCHKCWKIHHPRLPNTYTEQAFAYCCIGCDKPGIGSMAHDPSNNSNSDCALCCIPCTIVVDVLCFIPMCMGYINVEIP